MTPARDPKQKKMKNVQKHEKVNHPKVIKISRNKEKSAKVIKRHGK